mgnify:CR=1 FL=1
MIKIKICGLTNKEDALCAAALGVDALGFIFCDSPRCITPDTVESIRPFLPPFMHVVGVFMNHPSDYVNEVATQCGLDSVQLHGDESPEYCMAIQHRIIKTFSVETEADLDKMPLYQGLVSGILVDTKVQAIRGGTGRTFDWTLATVVKEQGMPLILAGGINAGNIKKAIQLVSPYAIDISSGVESEPGKKEYNKMSEVIQLVKGR